MKNKYYFLVALIFLVSNTIFSQAPTTASTNLSFSSIDGDKIRLSFTKGDGAKRIIVAKAGNMVTAIPADGIDYLHNATFGNGQEIEPGEFVVYDGTGNSNILITGLAHSTIYYIKIFEYNGDDFSTEYLTASFLEGSKATLSAPTTQASNIQFSNISGTSMTVSWTKGNGARRLLIIRENTAVDTEPTDLSVYFAHPSGINISTYEIGTGNYVVYNSTLSSVNVLSLNPNTTYHFALFEFNGGLSGNTGSVYLRPGVTANQLTSAEPTLNASNFNFSNISGSKFSYQFTKGNGQRRIVIAKQGAAVTATPVNGTDYNHNTTFGLGQEIAPGEFVVFDGTGAVNAIPGLSPNNIYFLKVFEYNGTGTNTFYLTGTDSNTNPPLEGSQATIYTPTTQASNIQFSNILGSSMTVSWTNGNGVGRVLIIRENAAVNTEPVDLTSYSGNSYSFGNSSFEIGTGNYVVYIGTSNTVNIFNLNPISTYHFALFEYNSSVYLRPGATASQLTTANPTLNATNLSFSSIDGDQFTYSFTRGNGGRYIAIVRKGSAVTAIPVDGINYTHNITFGVGQEIAPGEFVVFDGNDLGNFRPILGLELATEYYIKVFEYNGTGSNTLYLTGDDSINNPPLVGNQSTVSAPTTQASNIQFSNILGSSMKVSWTNGTGTSRLLIIRENTVVNTEPVDLTSYAAHPSGINIASYEIGIGNYVMFSFFSGSSVNITNLNPNTTYHFALFEYNGSSGRAYLRPGVTASQTTVPLTPTLNASNLNFTNIDGNQFDYSFTQGNGERRIVVAKQETAVLATPADGIDYTHNTTFGDGQQIAPGEFVVYDGTASSSTISGLNPATDYFLKVFEYNSTGTGTLYLTGNDSMSNLPIEGSRATLTIPTIQASNIVFSDISGSSITVGWTNGDGSGRLLIIRENNAVDTEPIDLTSYSSSAGGFSNPTYEIGSGNYAVYSDTGTSVDLTNINTSNTYHFALFEYNGINGKLFLTPGATTSRLDVETFNYSIGVNTWPNPSNNYFNIELITNNKFDKVEIYVYDILGKQVYYNKFNPGNVYRFGKELAGGVYISKVKQAGKMNITNLIKF